MLMCCFCPKLFPDHESLGAHIKFGGHGSNCSWTFVCKQPNCNTSVGSFHPFIHHIKIAHANHENEYVDVPNDVIEQPQEIEVQGDIDGAAEADPDPVPFNGEANGPDLSLDYFISNFYSNVQMFIAQLYAHPNTSRKLVDSILSSAGVLFGSTVTLLKRSLFDLLGRCDSDDESFAELIDKVKQMLLVLGDPFQDMRTEHSRFCELEKDGLFIKPEPFEMGTVDKYKKVDNVIQLVKCPVYGQFVPMRKVLKCFLELPGMYDIVLENYRSLVNDQSGIVTNFVQGELWGSISDSSKICLPLHLEFDDYEPDNTIGSHSGAHSIGALYAHIACLPSEIMSLLDNIFLFCLFESSHRKEFGNRAAFRLVLDELKYLQEVGILVQYNGNFVRVYFYFSLIIGDNLGSNQIQGFIAGFRGRYYCRFCKMHRDDISCHCRAVPEQLLRTVDNYDADVLLNDQLETGVKEKCVWNDVPSYHCVLNGTCDVLHDVSLGMLKYDVCRVLYNLIHIRGYFSVDKLKERIDSFDFGPCEVGNKPPTLHFTVEKLEACSLNLSASEMLCLFRYLGEMVGDLVPLENQIWKFYLLGREILDIVMCPRFVTGMNVYLDTLVSEHHALSIRFFGDVKPKHHFLLHYGALMKRIGPLVAVSALPCERFHRRGKLYANVSSSRVNFPLSVALKLQLSLCERLMRTGSPRSPLKITKLSHQPAYTLLNFEEYSGVVPFQRDDYVSSVKAVKVSGTLYGIGMIVVLNIENLLPTFGKLFQIITVGESVEFVVKTKRTVAFLPHIAAYEVTDSNEYVYLQQKNLIYFLPLWERKTVDGTTVISLKHCL